MRQQGIVKCWSFSFGFIGPLSGAPDIFVHQTDVVMKNVRDFRELYPGDLVEYEAELGDRGFHAVRVKVIEPAQTAAGEGDRS